MKQSSVCQICGTTDFEVRHVEYIYRRNGNYLIVRDVPCEVCLHCGEHYYPGDVPLKIEEKFLAIHERHLAPQATVQIPVEVYALGGS